MRIGKNPAKSGLPAYQPQRLGVALIVYIPFMEGFFQNSLEIVQYCIASLHASTSEKFDLLVFDNGSCPEVVSALQELYAQKRIDWLVLSQHNLGKAGAWNWIFSAMPNELICYADSDVLFRPGWLEASLRVLEAFPQAGMVSAQPNFFDVLDGAGRAQQALEADLQFELGEYLPEKAIIDEYCYGIGADEELSARFHNTPLPYATHRPSGARAVIGASHMQFIIPRRVARQVTPLPATKGLLRAETLSLDRKVDDLGYLHLSTQENRVFHMGNTVTERLQAELAGLNIGTKTPARRAAPSRPGRSWLHRGLFRLNQQPRFNRLFLRTYNLLFRVLYAER